MTQRHLVLDNLQHRLDRAANTIPNTIAHLNEQRNYAVVLTAQDTSAPHAGGGIADPTGGTACQLDDAEYRIKTINDWIDSIALGIKRLEEDQAAFNAWRMGQKPRDTPDDAHLQDGPQCIMTGCHQIPTPRPDGQGGTIDDGRCLDCGKIYDAEQAALRAERLQRRAQTERNRYGRV